MNKTPQQLCTLRENTLCDVFEVLNHAAVLKQETCNIFHSCDVNYSMLTPALNRSIVSD